MSIDNVNLILTIVSIVVTSISIFCSISSFQSAKKAWQYKEETCKLKDTMDLKSLTSNFMIESLHFLKQTHSSDWFRGIDVNTVTSPFTSVLMSFGASYHLMNNGETMKAKVRKLTSQVVVYETLDIKAKKKCQDLIIDISNLLQEEVQKCTKGIIKNNN